METTEHDVKDRQDHGASILEEFSRCESGFRHPSGVWFECGQQEVHCGVESAAPDTRRHPALLTDDVDSLRVQLERAGFEVVFDREIPGYRRFYTRVTPSGTESS